MSTHEDIAAAITLDVVLGERRKLTISTYVPRDAELGAYNAVLDKLGAAADRQEAKGKLIDLRRELKQARKNSENHAEDYQRIEQRNAEDWERTGKKGPPKLSTQEIEAQRNAKIAAGRYQKIVTELEDDIAAARELIG